MSTLEILKRKIAQVLKYLDVLTSFNKYSLNDFRRDIILQGSLERFMYLTIQSTIDLASALIAYKSFRKPLTNSDIFVVLSKNGIISFELAEKMKKMVGMRNIIAHKYGDLDLQTLYNAMQSDLKDISNFINAVKKCVIA